MRRNRVIVLEKAVPAASTISVTLSQQAITGRVSGTDGAVAGASIQVRGTNRGTATDGQGYYRIDAAPGEILVFTALGYQEQTITIGNQSTVNITLQAAVQDMDEVVVIPESFLVRRRHGLPRSSFPELGFSDRALA